MNVTSLTDSSGSVVKNYVYDAFGVEQNIDSNDTNPFRYCGEYYDSEIGQIYLRARYYDPSLGRFTQSDPAMSGSNWYVYCSNNPIYYIDSDGLVEYEKFTDPDKAAEDWAWNYYAHTDYLATEYGAIIFTWTENGVQYYSYTYAVRAVDNPHATPTDLALQYVPDYATPFATIHNHSSQTSFSSEDTKNTEKGYCGVYRAYVVVPHGEEGKVNVLKYRDTRKGYQVDTVVRGLTFNPLSEKRKNDLYYDNIYANSKWIEHLHTPNGGCRDCREKYGEDAKGWPEEK